MSNATTTSRIRPVQIRMLLEKTGWTNVELAERIACRDITIRRWLNGLSVPKGANEKALRSLLTEWEID